MSPANEKSRCIRRMFDRIGRRYDLLNHLLSGYSDILWRRSALRALNASAGDLLLDVGTGTGDLALEALKGKEKPALVIGVDAALEMMRIGRKKTDDSADRVDRVGHMAHTGPMGPKDRTDRTGRTSPKDRTGCTGRPGRTIRFVGGCAESLPLRSGIFDGVMVAFGVRNFTDRAAGLRCMWRVLKPGGRLVVLELSLPRYPLVRALYRLYAVHVMPRIGGLISGDADAYRYLQRSVAAFPDREGFRSLMEGAGFADTGWRDLSLGVATIYWGDKRS